MYQQQKTSCDRRIGFDAQTDIHNEMTRDKWVAMYPQENITELYVILFVACIDGNNSIDQIYWSSI
jgi:hypothetical protein